MNVQRIISMAFAMLMLLVLSACDGDYSSPYTESCDSSCTSSTQIEKCEHGCNYGYDAGKSVRVDQIGHHDKLYPRETVSTSVPLRAPPAIVVAETPSDAGGKPETAIGTAYIIERAVVVSVTKQPPAVVPPVKAPPVVASVTSPPSAGGDELCMNAPVLTAEEIFRVTGRRHLWKRSGVDQVRGAEPDEYLKLLGFTKEEQDYFRGAIAQGKGKMGRLKNGTKIGNMTSRSGKVMRNAVVAFNPVPRTGNNHVRDNRVRTYTYERSVILAGQCVKRVVTLLEPLVCGNWSRVSDRIIPVTQRALAKTVAKAKKNTHKKKHKKKNKKK